MLLRSLTIKNYRSLEDVRLDKLERFNVLIGRNNSGKSSVFGALQELNATLQGGGAPPDRVLTDSDRTRSLEITLTFDFSRQDREEFASLVATTDAQRNRRQEMLDSPMLRQVEYYFKAPAGQSQLLHLRETRVRTEDNEWAVTQKVQGDELISNPASRVVDLGSYGDQLGAWYFNHDMIDVDTVMAIRASLTTELDVRKVMLDYAAGSLRTHHPATTWLQEQPVKYLGDAFFFDPFRHSVESAGVQEISQLDQTGSSLPQVLHTINSNDRRKFLEIERFVQDALPDVGDLQTPLEGSSTMVVFLRPPGGYPIRLYDMGGGIEQLLMAAYGLRRKASTS